VTQARMNLHIEQRYGDDVHHVYESVFKGFARAFRAAAAADPRERGVPSSKGTI
jgi:imidazoleglycerol-phosphate dehydratase